MTPQKSQNHLFPLSIHEKTSSPPKFFFQDQAKRAKLSLPTSRGCNLGCTTKSICGETPQAISWSKLKAQRFALAEGYLLLQCPRSTSALLGCFCLHKKPQAEELNEAKSRLALREPASLQIQDFVAG